MRLGLPTYLRRSITAAVVFLTCTSAVLGQKPVNEIGAKATKGSERADRIIDKLPMSFEANQGRFEAEVKYFSRGLGYNLILKEQEAALEIKSDKNESATLRMKTIGSRAPERVIGLGDAGKSNYFIGKDPTSWRAGTPNYARVEYKGIYPGIDLAYHGNQRRLEYDLIVAPGADPQRIAIAFEGARKTHIDSNGDLVLELEKGEIRQEKPFAYQQKGEGREAVSCSYVLKGENRIGFQVAAYDKRKTLVIDPTITYSTFIGGLGGDSGRAVAIDVAGNIYVAGRTDSINFPTKSPFQMNNGGTNGDVFITKLNPAGNALIYSTYLGGSSEDAANGIAIDGMGNVYVSGSTRSVDFPLRNPFQMTSQGGDDVFAAKLNSAGTALIYSTYIGGSGNEAARAIAVDSTGSAYITGFTSSSDFPLVRPFQSTTDGTRDAFAIKMSTTGNALIYSTYLGGNTLDSGEGIAVDSMGNAYVTGVTISQDFPVFRGFQPVYGGNTDNRVGGDAFLTKFSPTGTSVVFSSYLGGSGNEGASDIALDSTGNIYLTGATDSLNFPMMNPIQAVNNGLFDAFITKINAAGSALVYSTYLGGANNDAASGIAVDSTGSAYVSGNTLSLNFPMTDPIQTVNAGLNDMFIAKLNSAGSALVYSTYLGGVNFDSGDAVAVDNKGNAYVVGLSLSIDFPTRNALQAVFGGTGSGAFSGDGIIAKIADTATPNFSLMLSPTSVTLKRRQSQSIVVNIVRSGGLTDNISVRASNPNKLKLIPANASTTGASLTFMIKANKNAPIGSQQVMIIGQDGMGRQRTAILTVTVRN